MENTHKLALPSAAPFLPTDQPATRMDWAWNAHGKAKPRLASLRS